MALKLEFDLLQNLPWKYLHLYFGFPVLLRGSQKFVPGGLGTHYWLPLSSTVASDDFFGEGSSKVLDFVVRLQPLQ